MTLAAVCVTKFMAEIPRTKHSLPIPHTCKHTNPYSLSLIVGLILTHTHTQIHKAQHTVHELKQFIHDCLEKLPVCSAGKDKQTWQRLNIHFLQRFIIVCRSTHLRSHSRHTQRILSHVEITYAQIKGATSRLDIKVQLYEHREMY